MAIVEQIAKNVSGFQELKGKSNESLEYLLTILM